jgi:hypothetical protein
MVQTAENTVRIPKPSDARIITLFMSLSNLVPQTVVNITSHDVGLGTFQSLEKLKSAYPDIDFEKSKLITQINLNFANKNLSCYFSRSVSQLNHNNVFVKVPSAWENEIWVDRPGQGSIDPQLNTAVWAILGQFTESITKDGDSSAVQRPEIVQIFTKQLAELASLQSQITLDMERSRLDSSKRFDELTSQLQLEYSNYRLKLDAEIEAKRLSLIEEVQSLEKQKKALDDRGHMHARRELRTQISETLKDRLARPGVSRQATFQKNIIIVANALGILLSGTYACFVAIELHDLLRSPVPIMQFVILLTAARFSLAALVAGGLLFYLLGWLRQNYSEDVRAERELERYRYDIDRASWAIETILEAQGKESGKVPDRWIEGVTHALFERVEPKEDTSALEGLNSLLNVAARLEVGPAGPKLEIEKRGLRKMVSETKNG